MALREPEPSKTRVALLAILGIANVWVDRWPLSFIFGGVTCLLGAAILIAGAASTGPQRKESRAVGFLLLIAGTFLPLLEAYDRFVIRYR